MSRHWSATAPQVTLMAVAVHAASLVRRGEGCHVADIVERRGASEHGRADQPRRDRVAPGEVVGHALRPRDRAADVMIATQSRPQVPSGGGRPPAYNLLRYRAGHDRMEVVEVGHHTGAREGRWAPPTVHAVTPGAAERMSGVTCVCPAATFRVRPVVAGGAPRSTLVVMPA